MNSNMQPYEKAGYLYFLVGWFGIISIISTIVSLGLAILVFPEIKDQSWFSPRFVPIFAVLMAFFLADSLFDFVLAKALRLHKNWARIIGIVKAALGLIVFPVGTIIGGFILNWLLNGWGENQDKKIIEP